MKVTLKTLTPNTEINIVEIARVSSDKEDKSLAPEKLLKYLLDHKHFSPFEHSYMTIEIITSRAIGAQLLRHRSFTFQEFSQRYSVVVGYEDIELRKQHSKNRQSSEEVFDPQIEYAGQMISASEAINKHLAESVQLYHKLIDAQVAKETARFILPLSSQTKIYMTGSIRSWIHFLEIRDDQHAQKEIQLIAKEIKKIFIEHLPIISKFLGYDKNLLSHKLP